MALGAINPLGVIIICAILWVALIWPITVGNRIGKRKGRRGWIYPLVGFCVGLGGLGAWLGVWIIHSRRPMPGFSEYGPVPKLKLPPSTAAAVYRDETPKPTHQPYVPPKRCPACRGLIPADATACARCGHNLFQVSTT